MFQRVSSDPSKIMKNDIGLHENILRYIMIEHFF
jgi:hypothetical protein